jgi:hypothetical protein
MANFVTILNPLVTAEQVSSAVLALDNAGGQLLQVWGGSILIAEGDENAQNAVSDLGPLGGVTLVTAGPVPNFDLLDLAPGVQPILDAWNLSLTPDYQATLDAALASNLTWDDFLAPEGCNDSSQLVSAPDGVSLEVAGLFGLLPVPQTRLSLRFPDRRALVGNIGVAVLVIDGKDGTTAAFGVNETMGALAAIKVGLQKLQEQAPAEAHLVFHPFLWGAKVDIDPSAVPLPANPKKPTDAEFTAAENVFLNQAYVQLRALTGMQIQDGLVGLGDIVKNTPFMFNVDWGYAIVITKYPAAWTAYVPGTRDVIISYTMWANFRITQSIDPLPLVVAHETGHTVDALDEYAKSECNSLTLCGWSHTVNGNCFFPFAGVPCLMNGGTFETCSFTRRHFGWGDEDNDGVLDPYFVEVIFPPVL